LNARVASQSAQLDQLKSTNKKMTQDSASVRIVNVKLKKQLEKLSKQVDQAVQKEKLTVDEYHLYKDTFAKVMQQSAELEGRLKLAESLRLDTERHCQNLQSQLDQLTLQKSEQEEKLKNAWLQAEQLTVEQRHLNQLLDRLTQEKTQLESKWSTQSMILSQLVKYQSFDQVQRLIDQVDSKPLQALVQKIMKERHGMDSFVKFACYLVGKKMDGLFHLPEEERFKLLETVKESLGQLHQEGIKNKNRWLKESELHDQEIQRVKEELTLKEDNEHRLQQSLDQMKAEKQHLSNEIQELTSQVHDLTQHKEQANQQIHLMNSTIVQLHQKIRSIQKDHLMEKMSQVTFNKMDGDLVQAQAEIHRLLLEKSTIQLQLEELKSPATPRSSFKFSKDA
jgi:chromosome segregation ATPase